MLETLHRDTIEDSARLPGPGPLIRSLPETTGHNRYEIPLGVCDDGSTVIWPWSDAPHLAVIGDQAGDKTPVLTGVIAECAYRGFGVFVAASHGSTCLRDWPNVLSMQTEIDQQAAMIVSLARSATTRAAAVSLAASFEPLILVIDDFQEFVTDLQEWYAAVKTSADPDVCPALTALTQLTRQGRELNVHLVVAVQGADAECIADDVWAMGTWISLGRWSGLGVPGQALVFPPTNPVAARMYWAPDLTQSSAARGVASLYEVFGIVPATVARHSLPLASETRS